MRRRGGPGKRNLRQSVVTARGGALLKNERRRPGVVGGRNGYYLSEASGDNRGGRVSLLRGEGEKGTL